MQRLNQLSDEFLKLRYGLSLRTVYGTRRRLEACNPSNGNAKIEVARKHKFNLAVRSVICRQRGLSYLNLRPKPATNVRKADAADCKGGQALRTVSTR